MGQKLQSVVDKLNNFGSLVYNIAVVADNSMVYVNFPENRSQVLLSSAYPKKHFQANYTRL